MKTSAIILIVLFAIFSAFAQQDTQTFLSIDDTGVEEFHNTYPEYDGRETIILILDTGVDIGIDGLTQTSTGEVKFIDVQDFTHQGDVQLYEADVDNDDGKIIFKSDNEKYSVIASSPLQFKPEDDKYFIGGLDEAIFLNSRSGAGDLNGDGDMDDVYQMIAFETSEGSESFWVVYLDLNDNGDISDDRPLRNYREKLDAFTFKDTTGLPPLTMGLNVLPDEKIVSFHFDDGSHGTHVAGIAGGYQIGGIDLNGIAPGAKMMSLKLGNNLYSGGATVTESMKKAYLYADKISKEQKVPCILNMSFGIGSELEGQADMEAFLENLTKENPYLYISLGAGNEGPGISSIGLPSASYAVVASGAVLTQEVGRDLYGATLNRDIILYFSSRGGEVSKPDVCSPGACTSTVPNWKNWDRFWGTSMAAPYSAGVMSLLLSAATKEYPGVKIPSQLLYKAIRESATHMDGYNQLDQGHGYINAINAYKLLKKYIDDGEINKFETYSISSTVPNFPFERGPNLYLRNGSFVKDESTFTYSVKRRNFQKTDKFYRAYLLESDSDWLIPIQKKTYIRNDQPTYITVKFNNKKMQKPGINTARITAYRDDKSRFPEFEMLATVVIPYTFCSENNYTLNLTSKKVEQGLIDHYFIELPAGQTEMNINLSSVKNKYARVRFHLFDPDGVGLDVSPVLHTLDGETEVEENYFNLTPGVYEVDVEGYFLAKDTSTYNLTIQFNGINRLDNKIVDEENKNIEVVNLFDQAENYNLTGKFDGYEVEHNITIQGSEKFRLPFVLRKGEKSKEFKLEMSKGDYNKLTDLAFIIYDSEGLDVSDDALGFRTGSVCVTNISNEDSSEYVFEIVPGFAQESSSASIKLTEFTTFKSEYYFDVVSDRRSNVTLYPSLPKQLEINFDVPNEYFPGNSQPVGTITFESSSTKKTDCELPIKFKF
ncbi:MAG: S8 family serine peptidase [Psychromonas sp.]|jgi:subtilisin family serine protease|nr:S8 family serine peptidase [Psychromonas sp.]